MIPHSLVTWYFSCAVGNLALFQRKAEGPGNEGLKQFLFPFFSFTLFYFLLNHLFIYLFWHYHNLMSSKKRKRKLHRLFIGQVREKMVSPADCRVMICRYTTILVHHVTRSCLSWSGPGSGTHNPEHATPILSLCHDVCTDQVIFRQVYNYYFPRKSKFRCAPFRIPSKIERRDTNTGQLLAPGYGLLPRCDDLILDGIFLPLL